MNGSELQEALALRDLTASRFARYLGVNRSTVGRWLASDGLGAPPYVALLLRAYDLDRGRATHLARLTVAG